MIQSVKVCSVDSDASRLVLLGLGDSDAEDAISEASAHGVLINSGWEVESAGEFAERSLSEPVLGLVGRLGRGLLLDLLLGLLSFGNLRARLVGNRFIFVLNGGLMGVGLVGLFALLGDGTTHRGVLNEAGVGRTGMVRALRLAADEQGLGFGELDVNVLLADTRELAMELVGIFSLADVEFGLPGRQGSSAATLSLSLTRVVVEVVKEAEERSEGGVSVVERSREEGGHCACLFGDGVESSVLQVGRESSRKS